MDALKTLKTLTGEADSDLLTAYLDLAEHEILIRLWPFSKEEHELPAVYVPLQVEIAQLLWAKRGAEGESQRNENGIIHSYPSGDLPKEIIRKITPMVETLKR